MQITLRVNTISPGLRGMAAKLKNKQPLLRAMGEATAQMTKRAFNTAALRPTPWSAKRDGTAATLRKNQVLARSPRVVSVSADTALVGSDRKYAAIHQLGGRTPARVIRARKGKALRFVIGGRVVFRRSVKHPGSKMPARPFFPFYANRRPTPQLLRSVNSLAKRHLGIG